MDETQIERLQFHLDTGDYFRVLATIMGFLEETVENGCATVPKEMIDLQCQALTHFRKDLAYLYDHYEILPKQQI